MRSGFALFLVGLLYIAVVAAWLILEGTPSEPIGDPYLAAMELLTIASALALVGLCGALASLCSAKHRVLGLVTLAFGTLAAGLTTSVHFTQLTAVRQLWRSGALSDYRLIWPSPAFAVEYLAWDLLVGITMLLGAATLGHSPARRRARAVLVLGGLCCLAGLSGPASGQMLLQNVAVFGYAILLPVAAYLLARMFIGVPTSGSPPSDGR